jgi:hypothetical protein
MHTPASLHAPRASQRRAPTFGTSPGRVARILDADDAERVVGPVVGADERPPSVPRRRVGPGQANRTCEAGWTVKPRRSAWCAGKGTEGSGLVGGVQMLARQGDARARRIAREGDWDVGDQAAAGGSRGRRRSASRRSMVSWSVMTERIERGPPQRAQMRRSIENVLRSKVAQSRRDVAA